MNLKILNYIILILPLFIKYFFIIIFGSYQVVLLGDLIEDGVFFVLFCFALNIYKKVWFTTGILFLYVFCFILEGTSYLAVLSNFTASYMFILIESSTGEFREFLKSYFSFSIGLFISTLIIAFVFINRGKNKFVEIKNYWSTIVVIGLIILLKITGLIENNAYHNIVRGVYGYYKFQDNYKLNRLLTNDEVKLLKNNEVLVVIIGESTNRNHMQIYGYNRATTPLMNKIKDSLLVYNNVISTDVLTVKSLPKILTSMTNDGNVGFNVNLVNVLNLAGYKTFWLSNQRPISFNDKPTSRIASFCSFYRFYNYDIDTHASNWDETLLPDYGNILKKPGKKVIFLHLLGTHFNYDKRYPKAFNKYQTKPSNKKKNVIINQYDNAVLYNDYVVSSILDSLKQVKGKKAMVYFSDHGENVYDDGEFFGRVEANPKKCMFDIPFLVWASKDFEFPDDFEYDPQRKFMADHLYESISHLFGVKHDSMDFSKSIFSNSFKERKRVVIGGIDYDDVLMESND